jgi:4-hydroxy-tetrahydrodipicolinate reductase
LTTPIAVLVHGALGKMGQHVLSALCRDPELEPIAAVDLRAEQGYLSLPDGSGEIPLFSHLEPAIMSRKPDVLVDFSAAAAVIPMARIAAKHHINLVIGTTGLSAAALDEMEQLCREYDIGAIVAPNFSLGAVLMVQLAKVAAKFFDYAEVMEMHHEQKADAPSGTAITTAKEMTEARGKAFSYRSPEKETLAGSRGAQYQGVALHSLRMPGLLAHQEVVFGGAGETLRIRHDTISRKCYMPGVILAIKEVGKIKGLVRGLDKLLHF